MNYQAVNIQDRTREFQQCVSTFNRQLKTKPQPPPLSHKQKTEFSIRASHIAKDIAHVTNLLGKLALLAKRPAIEDKPVDVAELTYVIKQEIFKIERTIKELQSYVQSGGKVAMGSGNKNQISAYSKNVVQLLSTKTKNVSEEFKNVLEQRRKIETANKSRREQFLSEIQAVSGDERRSSVNLNHSSNTHSDNPFDDGSLPTSDLLTIPDSSQQMMLLEEQSNVYLQDRNRAVEAIESTINEVGNLFQQLATMVSEQGEVIQRIDTNVEDVSLNIEGAQRELLKYYRNISSNRWLMVKIFGILIVFFLLWVLVS